MRPALACSAEEHLGFRMVDVMLETGMRGEHMDMGCARALLGRENTVAFGVMDLNLWEFTLGPVVTHIVDTGTKAKEMG